MVSQSYTLTIPADLADALRRAFRLAQSSGILPDDISFSDALSDGLLGLLLRWRGVGGSKGGARPQTASFVPSRPYLRAPYSKVVWVSARCPLCGAPPGFYCLTRKGRETHGAHTVRRILAEQFTK